eukprot:PITA_09348
MIWVADLVPEMFYNNAYENFIKPVSEEELLSAIKSFKKDRSPGPDGWPIEFFIHFYDMFKTGLLRTVEASRISGNMHSALSSTFIAFIPKKNQHAFLRDQNIWDVVAMTQECLFSMVSNNTEAAILKIDLKKAYDCVDWGFLRILLAKIGLRSKGIEWVMACVENVHYSVIINGIPSSFFKAERGLCQGCPLSPLLFILVMNTLSLQINRAVADKQFRPVKVCKDIYLSHNLFVDDILIFAMLCKQTWICINSILQKFQSASGILINTDKSKLFHNGTNDELILWIVNLLGVGLDSISSGIKYLGFNLKAKGYRKQDWSWLIDRFYCRIAGWEWRFLSLAGRFILVQAVLSQLAVYWAHLYLLPVSISKKMCSLAANFLWGGKSKQSKIHLVKLEDISRPRNEGSWGLLNLRSFGKALICKSLHRGIFGNGPWSRLINRKYLKGKGIVFWYRRNSLGKRRGSAIWLGFRKLQHFFLAYLRWKIFSGSSIHIGFDLILNGPVSLFPLPLIHFFHAKGIFTWEKLIKSWSHSSPIWNAGTDLHLPPSLIPLWSSFTQSLSNMAIHHSRTKDVLVWALPSKPLPISVKHIYAALSMQSAFSSLMVFPMPLWKVTCPLKMVLFLWLVFCNRNLTWEVLQQKGWMGPGRCSMCQKDTESNLHMFFQCPISMFIWYDLSISYGFPYLSFSSVQGEIMWWSGQSVSRHSLFVHTCWLLWKWRNASIFQNSRKPVSALLCYIKAFHDI